MLRLITNSEIPPYIRIEKICINHDDNITEYINRYVINEYIAGNGVEVYNTITGESLGKKKSIYFSFYDENFNFNPEGFYDIDGIYGFRLIDDNEKNRE